MPFDRPSLARIETDLQADQQSRLPGTDPRLRRSYLGALARSLSGAFHELYGFLEWISEQRFVASADRDELLLQAAEYGITPIPAVRATGSITATGADGTAIPQGTIWRSGAGVDYRSTAAAAIPVAGSVSVAVEAVEPGAEGNAADMTRVSLVNPIAGLVSAAAADGAIAGGANVEDTDSVRRRLSLRKQQPPRGGTVSDYEFWALGAHADVTRAWGQALASGLGTVTVYIMTDDATQNGIPAQAVVDAVQAYIDARRPATADVTAAAPTAVALDFTINALDPMTQAVQDAVEAELADLILRESEPGGTILTSHIREAISTAAGEIDHDLTAPAADVTVRADEISVLGAVNFTDN